MDRPGTFLVPKRFLFVFSLLVLALLGVLSTRALGGSGQTAGVQVHLLWSNVDSRDMDRQLDRAKAAGAGLVRMDLGWATLEQEGKGRYDRAYLAKADLAVAKARARGLRVLFTLTQSPCWASSAPENLKRGCRGAWWDRGVERYTPRRPSDYAGALAFLVRRYGSRVSAWEVWNEPNLADFYVSDDEPRTYAALVRSAYAGAKRADPTSMVVAGSLSDSAVGFTRALYAHGIKGSFDAFSIHPYSGDRSPLDPFEDRWMEHSFIRGVPAVREVMVENGDEKPLWLTELGWSTCTAREGETWERCVDERTQSQHLRLAYDHMRSWDYVEVGVWYTLLDRAPDRDARIANYGLLRHDGSSKPAFEAFRAASSGSR